MECFPSKCEVIGSSLTTTNRMFNCWADISSRSSQLKALLAQTTRIFVCVCVHMLKSIYTVMYVCTCTVCACVLGGCTLILIVFLYHFPPIFWEGSLHWTWGSLMALMGQKVNYGNAPASLSPLLLSRLGSQKCATVPRSSCFYVKCFNHWALSLTLHK